MAYQIKVQAAGEQTVLDFPDMAGVNWSTLAGTTSTDKAERVPLGATLNLPAGAISAADMNKPAAYPTTAHFWRYPGRVLGSGADKTVITVDKDSLTQALTYAINPKTGKVWVDGAGKPYVLIENMAQDTSTNPYQLLRLDDCTEMAGFTLLGTDQLHNPVTNKPYSYSGLRFYGSKPRWIHDFKIAGVPGYAGVPPEETFALYAYKVAGSFVIERFEIDGQGNGSSAISWSTSDANLNIALRKGLIHGIPNGGGTTMFNTPGRSYLAEDVTVDGCLCGFNFEQASFSQGIKLVRPKVTNYGQGTSPWRAGYAHLSIESNAYSNRVDIYDPVLGPGEKFGVTISPAYGYSVFVPVGPQKQRGADIHLWTGGTWNGTSYVGGAEHPELIRWMRTAGAA